MTDSCMPDTDADCPYSLTLSTFTAGSSQALYTIRLDLVQWRDVTLVVCTRAGA
jgi:hypothetical protein